MTTVGLVGAGDAARRHARAIALVSDARIAWVADIDLERARALAAIVGAEARWFEAIDSAEADVVCICTPPSHHRAAAQTALSRGSHVLVEKPLAASLSDAEWFVSRGTSTAAQIGAISQHRYARASVEALRLIRAGALGQVTRATLTVRRRRERHYFVDSWKGRKHSAGGGALISLGYHTLDLALSWLARPLRARAVANQLSGSDVESELQGELSLADGSSLRIDIVTGDCTTEPDTIEVVGTEATLRWCGDALHCGNLVIEKTENLHQLQLADFLRCVRDGSTYAVTPAAVLPALVAIDALYRSIDRDAEVEVA